MLCKNNSRLISRDGLRCLRTPKQSLAVSFANKVRPDFWHLLQARASSPLCYGGRGHPHKIEVPQPRQTKGHGQNGNKIHWCTNPVQPVHSACSSRANHPRAIPVASTSTSHTPGKRLGRFAGLFVCRRLPSDAKSDLQSVCNFECEQKVHALPFCRTSANACAWRCVSTISSARSGVIRFETFFTISNTPSQSRSQRRTAFVVGVLRRVVVAAIGAGIGGGLRRYGFSSCLRPCLLGFGQLGPIKSEVIRPSSHAGKTPLRLDFNLCGQFSKPRFRDALTRHEPLVNAGRLDVQHTSHSWHAPQDINDFRIVHACSIGIPYLNVHRQTSYFLN
jgi:hypothetical protein